MADLYDRLFVSDPAYGKITIHYFRAALGDYADGQNTTRQQIIDYWTLDAEATADLDVLLAEIDAGTALQKAAFLLRLHDVMMIAEAGAKYQTKAAFRARLGLGA